jgi:hypothetical protein
MATPSSKDPLAETVHPRSPEQPESPGQTRLQGAPISRVKCYLTTGHTFVGWLYSYGVGYVGYTGVENTPAGVRVGWYPYEGKLYLWDVDSLSTSPRYLGPHEVNADRSAQWNLWGWAAAIRYDAEGDKRFKLADNPGRYCYAAGNSEVYWGDSGEALQFEFVPAQ